MYVLIIFESCHGGRNWAFKNCQQCERNPLNVAREARLAPRSADMGSEEQNSLKNVDGGEKQERCSQQRCKRLEGEQQGSRRLFLNWTFSWVAEFANWASCLFSSSSKSPSIYFQQTGSQQSKCVDLRLVSYLACFPYLYWYTSRFIPTLPDFLGGFTCCWSESACTMLSPSHLFCRVCLGFSFPGWNGKY